MEVIEATKRISLANDINTLSLDQLKEKYLKSETSTEMFLKEYAELFGRDLHYQYRVFDHLGKINRLVDDAYNMYPTEKNDGNAATVYYRADFIQKNEDYITRQENIQNAMFSFNVETGACKSKRHESYAKIINGMDEAAEKYKKIGKPLDDFPVFLNMLRYCVTPDGFDFNLGVYIKDHPLMKECKDIYFLYFANYVISRTRYEVHNGVEADPDFIKNVKDVINVSRIFDKKVIHPIIDSSDYERVANYTLKNINKYEKELVKYQKENAKKLEKSNK